MERNFPTISVIVPAYNVEAYIETAIDSLLNQSSSFHEIIVINDGSTDGTRERLRRYEDNPIVKIHHTENQGLGLARNTGIRHASGEFLYFFDSDDVMEPSFVASIQKEISNDPLLDLVFFAGECFYDENFKGFEANFCEDLNRKLEGKFESGIAAAATLYEAGGFLSSACLYISRRDLWNVNLRFLPILHEDAEVILKLCLASGRTAVINVPFFKRRIRQGSIMTMIFTKKHADGGLAAFKSACEVYRSMGKSNHRRFVRSWLAELMWWYITVCSYARVPLDFREIVRAFLRFGWMPAKIFQNTKFPNNAVVILRTIKINLKSMANAFSTTLARRISS